jgi:hypothetical protein
VILFKTSTIDQINPAKDKITPELLSTQGIEIALVVSVAEQSD